MRKATLQLHGDRSVKAKVYHDKKAGPQTRSVVTHEAAERVKHLVHVATNGCKNSATRDLDPRRSSPGQCQGSCQDL